MIIALRSARISMIAGKTVVFFVLMSILTVTGCAGIAVRQKAPELPYPGVKQDVENLSCAFTCEGSAKGIAGWLFPLFLIDLPLSFVVDTLLLPGDLIVLHRASEKTPRLEGDPDISGLVIMETSISSGKALGTVNGRGIFGEINVRGNVKIASMADPRKEVAGKRFKNTNYHIFAGISPGTYKLLAVDYHFGYQNTVLTFDDGISKTSRGSFDVRPGEPLYVGKLKVVHKRINGFLSGEDRDTVLEYAPSEEKTAWEALASVSDYAKSPWYPRIKERLEQITQ